MHLSILKYKFIHFVFLCIMLLNTNQAAKAQKTRLFFESYTIENGLPTPQIRRYVEDNNHIIWFATRSGLVNYNGYFFKVYNYSNSKIPSLSLSDLLMLKNSVLLISTRDKGFFTFDIKDNSIKTFVNDNSPLNNIVLIFIDNNKKLWIATLQNIFRSTITIDSLLKKEGNIDKYFVKCTNDENYKSVSCFVSGSDNSVWIGTRTGLLKYDTATSFCRLIKGTENLSIRKILNTQEGKFFIATNKGLLKFDPLNHKTIKINLLQNKENIYISDIIQDKRKNIWISTLGDGLLQFNPKKNTVYAYKSSCVVGDLTSNTLSNLYLNSQNILFISILNNGMNITKIDNYFIKYQPDENQNSTNNMIWGIDAVSNNKIYFAGKMGLNEINLKTGKIKNRISGIYLYKILKRNESTIFCNDINDKLYEYNIKQNKTSQIKFQQGDFKYITNYCNLSDTAQIISYLHGGLLMYDMKGKIKKYLVKKIKVGTMLFVGDSVLWLATRGKGLVKYSLKNNTLNYWSKKEGLKGDYLISLYKDSSDILWVGTFQGLSKFNLKTEKVEPLKYINQKRIYAIEEDNKHNLWLSTNEGLFKFNKKTLQFQRFNIKHGLQSNDFNELSCAKTPDGHLLFGGPRGLNYFHPDSVYLSTFIPKIVLTRFLLFHEEYLVGDKHNGHTIFSKNLMNIDTIHLYHDENTISIKFAAIDIFNSKNIRYKYRLKGYDEKWINANISRQANYTNLPPGEYIFQIKSTNSDGVWVDNTKNVHIIIQAAIWQRNWFKVLTVLFGIFLIYLVIRIRMHQVIAQQKKLKKLVSEQTKEIVEKNIELKEQTEELNRLAEQLRKANKNLEKKVKKRTHKLNKALENAQKAEKLITSFLSNISHEIRTPLNAISGFTQIIINTELPKEQEEHYGRIIEKNVDELLDEIDNIMNVAKLHTGKYQMHSETFKLKDVFNELADIFDNEKYSKSGNIKQIQEIPFDIRILSDKYAFKQIIYQLVDNALKYTEKGTVHYGYYLDNCKEDIKEKTLKTIHGRKKAKTVCFLTLFVRDTGIGISPKQQKYIFDAFMKVETKKRLFRGTGLGLALVKKFAETFNAEIKLNSEENKGTEILIIIPLTHI